MKATIDRQGTLFVGDATFYAPVSSKTQEITTPTISDVGTIPRELYL